MESDLHEMSKPLTRTETDTDREALLKETEREEDPMLAYMRKKKEKVGIDHVTQKLFFFFCFTMSFDLPALG